MTFSAVGLSLKGRYILLENDTTLPVVDMLDCVGESTQDPQAAVGIIYQRPEGTFSVEYVATFRDAELMIGEDA